MSMASAGDVARAAGAGTGAAHLGFYRRQHRWMLTHAEIIVRAPHGDLGAKAMIVGARKAPAPPLQIGEDTIAAFAMERVKPLLEKCVEVHGHRNRRTRAKISHRRAGAIGRSVAEVGAYFLVCVQAKVARPGTASGQTSSP